MAQDPRPNSNPNSHLDHTRLDSSGDSSRSPSPSPPPPPPPMPSEGQRATEQIRFLRWRLANLEARLSCLECGERDVERVFVPCGHALFCGRCCARKDSCALCRDFRAQIRLQLVGAGQQQQQQQQHQ